MCFGGNFSKLWWDHTLSWLLALFTNISVASYDCHNFSNHCQLDCLVNSLFRLIKMKTPKPHVTMLCKGKSPVTLLPEKGQLVHKWFNMITSHYSDIIMDAMVSQITSLTIVYWTIYSGADQRKHQSSASLAFEQRIHQWLVNSLHKWPVTSLAQNQIW